MNAFLDELDKALGNMSGEARKEILDDFREHFRLAREEGKTDEEIIKTLGAPNTIAKQFLEMGESKSGYKSFYASPMQSGNNYNEETNHYYGVSSNERAFGTDGVERIIIDVNTANIKVNADSQTQSIRTSVCIRDKKGSFHSSKYGGTIEITEDSPFSLLSFIGLHRKPTEITIDIPTNSKYCFELNNRFGRIELFNCNGVLLTIRCSLGDIQTGYAQFEKISANSKGGNIEFEHVSSGFTDLQATAGNIAIKESSGSLEAHSSAGNVKIRKHRGNVVAQSAAGNVRVENSEGHVKANTAAGNVKIQTAICEFVDLSSGAGNVSLSAEEVKGLKISALAGDAKAQVERILGDVDMTSGAGDVKLDANFMQGNINATSGAGTVRVKIPRETSIRVVTKKGMGSVKNSLPDNQQSPYTLTASSPLGTVKLIGT